MSHITTVEVTITDLEAVKALCREKGWEFREGQKSFTWFGMFLRDDPLNQTTTPEEYGKCDHEVRIPGCAYSIGLRKTDKGYAVVFDPFMDGKLVPAIGAKAGKFMQGYGICKTEMEAKRRGLHVRRVQGQAGAVKLVLTGSAL